MVVNQVVPFAAMPPDSFLVSTRLLDRTGKVLQASLGRSWVQVFQEFSAEFGLRYLPT